MVLEHTNYRSFLRAELAERIGRNPAYSLRAFARQIGISAPSLSLLLNEKQNFSPTAALRAATRIGLSGIESEYFCQLVNFETTKSPELKAAVLAKLSVLNPKRQLTELSVDRFKSISDWYHVALLEMTEIQGADFSPRALAKRLGIAPVEVEAALERLQRLELIEEIPGSKGSYRKVKRRHVAKSMVPSEAIRKFHRQMLEKAMDSIEGQTPEERVIGTEMFSIASEHIEEARKLRDEFFAKMAELSERPGRKNDVYGVGLQFYRVTTPLRGKKS
jgi:uncharacterized protein (TIGR02147 family)